MTSSYICMSCRQRAFSIAKPNPITGIRRALTTRSFTRNPELHSSQASPCLTRNQGPILRIAAASRSAPQSRRAARQFTISAASRVPAQTTTGSSNAATAQPPASPAVDRSSITILPRARERLRALAQTSDHPVRLRVSVLPGGCHGFQYTFTLEDPSSPTTAAMEEFDPEEDREFGDDPQGAKVVVDEASLEIIGGAKVDYAMELIGSQFKMVDIPGSTSGCGCGSSFDVKE